MTSRNTSNHKSASLWYHPKTAGLLAAALFLSNGVVLYEMPIAYVDLAYAFFFLLAFYFLSQALDRPGEDGYLLFAGLCCGTLAGVKLNPSLAGPSWTELSPQRELFGRASARSQQLFTALIDSTTPLLNATPLDVP